MPSLFFSYSHADEALRDQLQKQLTILVRQGVIETWHDRRIGAGEEWAAAIDEHVETDDIILLLVSPDFLDSDYCYDREMLRAMERHDAGEAIVIPIILRPCAWKGAPFGKLQAVPKDGKPVTLMPDRDSALLEVVEAVRAAAEKIAGKSKPRPLAAAEPAQFGASEPVQAAPRSSNLRLAKHFTERDKDTFRLEAFEYLARFFETSLTELESRNPGIESSFRRVDANRFTGAVYRNGKAEARCTIFMGGHFGSPGIGYVHGETTESNSFNEQLTVLADDESMFLRSMGMMRFSGGRREDEKLTLEGAAELYWDRFIEPLQRS